MMMRMCGHVAGAGGASMAPRFADGVMDGGFRGVRPMLQLQTQLGSC